VHDGVGRHANTQKDIGLSEPNGARIRGSLGGGASGNSGACDDWASLRSGSRRRSASRIDVNGVAVGIGIVGISVGIRIIGVSVSKAEADSYPIPIPSRIAIVTAVAWVIAAIPARATNPAGPAHGDGVASSTPVTSFHRASLCGACA
jgi:hypothetical protein